MNIIKYYNSTYYLWNGFGWIPEDNNHVPSTIQKILGNPNELKYLVKKYQNKKYFFNPEVFGFGKWQLIKSNKEPGNIAPESVQKALGGKNFDIDRSIQETSANRINDALNTKTQGYAKAERIRETGVGNIAYRMMLENKDKGLISSLKESGKMVLKAKTVDRFKEMIDPLNMIMKLTGSPLLTTAVGRIFKRTNSDIRYFAEGKHTAYERLSSNQEIIPNRETANGIYKNSSVHDVLTRIYKLLYTWKSEELKNEDLKQDVLNSDREIRTESISSNPEIVRSEPVQDKEESNIFSTITSILAVGTAFFGLAKFLQDRLLPILTDLPKTFEELEDSIYSLINFFHDLNPSNVANRANKFWKKEFSPAINFYDKLVGSKNLGEVRSNVKDEKEKIKQYVREKLNIDGTRDKKVWINENKIVAQQISEELDVPFDDILARMAYESDYGKNLKAKNNIFGIKADSEWKGDSKNGYREYDSLDDMVKDFIKFNKENNNILLDNPGGENTFNRTLYSNDINNIKEKIKKIYSINNINELSKPKIVNDNEIDTAKILEQLDNIKKLKELDYKNFNEENKKYVDEYIKKREDFIQKINTTPNLENDKDKFDELLKDYKSLSNETFNMKQEQSKEIVPNNQENLDEQLEILQNLAKNKNKSKEELLAQLDKLHKISPNIQEIPKEPRALTRNIDETIKKSEKLQAKNDNKPVIINNNSKPIQNNPKQVQQQEFLLVRNDEPVYLQILSGNFKLAVS